MDRFVGNVRITAEADGLDIEKLDEMLRSKAWGLVARRMDEMVEYERAALESAAAVDDVRRAQGAIAALRRAKELPRILRQEFVQKVRT